MVGARGGRKSIATVLDFGQFQLCSLVVK